MHRIQSTAWRVFYASTLNGIFTIALLNSSSWLAAIGVLKYRLESNLLGFILKRRQIFYRCPTKSTNTAVFVVGMPTHDDSSSKRSYPDAQAVSDCTIRSTDFIHSEEFQEVVDKFGCIAYESRTSTSNTDRTDKIYASDDLFVRLEKECNATFHSTDYILSRIDEVRTEQSRYANSELYSRYWKRKQQKLGTIRSEFDDGFSINEFSTNDKHVLDLKQELYPSNRTIKIAQFNTLAEGLSSGPNTKTPFMVDPRMTDRVGQYGGFSSIQHPDITLDFSKRKWRLLEAILGGEPTGRYDIIAMEEVDRYYGFFKPIMNTFGYNSVFTPKKNSRGVSFGFYSDGCCLFWKRNMFELLSFNSFDYSVGHQVLLIVKLRHKPTQTLIVVAVTHLKAQKGESNERIRQIQIKELLHSVEAEVISLYNAKSAKEERSSLQNTSFPVFIMGDMNADPPSTNPSFSVSAIRSVLDFRHQTLGEIPLEISGPYYSAYEVDPPENSFYTSWKIRGKDTTKRIIDYIFYKGPVTCIATLQVPNDDEVEETKFPGLRYPSDHLLIAADFELD